MSEEKYRYLSKKSKIIALVLAIVLAMILSMWWNTKYIKAKMTGEWVVSEQLLGNNLDLQNKGVTLTPTKLVVDNQEIAINYGRKSWQSNIKRNDEQGQSVYIIKDKQNPSIHYSLFFNPKEPDEMLLFCTDADKVEMPYSLVLSRKDS